MKIKKEISIVGISIFIIILLIISTTILRLKEVEIELDNCKQNGYEGIYYESFKPIKCYKYDLDGVLVIDELKQKIRGDLK